MSETLRSEYLQQFNNFIRQLKVIFPTEEYLNNLELLSDEEKLANGILYTSLINGDNLEQFVKSKVKVFSHKSNDTQLISESLFGKDFCLKNLVNNQPDEIKTIIWMYLHNLCVMAELCRPEDEQNKLKLELLNNQIMENKELFEKLNSDSSSKKRLEDILGVDINDETTSMINDIVASFEKILSSGSGNPMSSIMEISQKISTKYSDKINSGEIELDKLMASITKKVPGMEGMIGNMFGMFGKKNAEPQEKVLIDENFSTSSIVVGEQENETNNFNIGNILKMANNLGVLSPGSGGEQGEGFDLSKVMSLMSNLNQNDENGEGVDLNKVMSLVSNLNENGEGLDLNGLLANLSEQMAANQEEQD